MKITLCLCVVLAMLLLVGCSTNDPGTAVTPSEEELQTTEVTTTTEQGPIADSVFGDPKYGDEKPVKTDDSTETTGPEQDTSTESTDTKQEGSEGNSNTGNGNSTALPAPGTLTYEQFIALTPAQQQEYQASYGLDEAGLEAFFKWYNEAKAAYEKEHPPEEIPNNGKIELG